LKTASVNELKKEMLTLTNKEVIESCLRIIKFRKENKELLTYLLFDARDEASYIADIKNYINEAFPEVKGYNIYTGMKMIRKILKNVNKYIKYSGKKQTEVEVRLAFCAGLKAYKQNHRTNDAFIKLYQTQVQKIEKAIGSLHEDLQFDYSRELLPFKS